MIIDKNMPVVDTKLYDILEVSPDADPSTIKKAYRTLAKKYHPDKNGGDGEKFKEIDAAYKVLSDENLREMYDTTGSVDASGTDVDMDILSQLFGGLGGFGSPFGGMFGGFGIPKQRNVTPDVVHEISLPLESFYSGRKKTISVKRNTICQDCGGKGGSSTEVCTKCRGQGAILVQQQNGPFIMQSQQRCPSCEGKGKIVPKDKACKSCGAKCYLAVKSNVELVVPPGAPNGHVITIPNMADEYVGMSTGSLHIVVKEKKHENYTRHGDSLLTQVTVDLATALVGGNVQFKHLDGQDVEMKLEKGHVISTGDQKTITGRGMPVMNRDGEFGDLVVTLRIQMPSDEWAKRVDERAIRDLFD